LQAVALEQRHVFLWRLRECHQVAQGFKQGPHQDGGLKVEAFVTSVGEDGQDRHVCVVRADEKGARESPEAPRLKGAVGEPPPGVFLEVGCGLAEGLHEELEGHTRGIARLWFLAQSAGR
jgi:hypothetical protein